MPTSIPTPLPLPGKKPVRRARSIAILAVGLLLLLAAVWSGLWYFIADRAEAGIAEALAREARLGRTFSCGSRQVLGFPFRILVRCDAPKLEIERPSGMLALAATRLTGVAQIYDPGHIIVEADGPLSIDAPGVAAAEVEWRSLLASFVTGGSGLDHGDLSIEAPNLRVRDGQNMIASKADRFELHLRRDPQRPPPDDAVQVSAQLSHLASPILDAVSGNATPADVDIDASISQVAALQPGEQEAPPLQPIERWRRAGGGVRVTGVKLVKAGLKAGFSGDLALDDQHRGAGRIDVSLDGAEGLLPRLGLPPAAASFLRLNGGSLRLPLALTNGRLVIGPFAIARLLPLY